MEMPDLSTRQPDSSLFTIRLWQEARGDELREVRMQVRHVLSGETRYFRAWLQLEEYLEQKLHEANDAQQAKGDNKNQS